MAYLCPNYYQRASTRKYSAKYDENVDAFKLFRNFKALSAICDVLNINLFEYLLIAKTLLNYRSKK